MRVCCVWVTVYCKDPGRKKVAHDSNTVKGKSSITILYNDVGTVERNQGELVRYLRDEVP